MSYGTYHPVRLPMYDWPEVRVATAELENALQAALVDALGLPPADMISWPNEIDAPAMWDDPGVLLVQTCGYPLTHALKGKVRLLGVPHYSADGCEGPRYCSQLVVSRTSGHERLEDLRGLKAAYNGPDSQSGMNAFRHAVARCAGGTSFFSQVFESGSHLRSLEAIADGQADVASIDAVCWALACQELPALTANLKCVGHTEGSPGLPLITSTGFSQDEALKMTEVIRLVLSDPSTAECRKRLRISGFSSASVEDYDPILEMELEAVKLGYPDLA